MSQSSKTPVAFFAFNRPLHASQALDSLSGCSRLDECHVYAFCDGARSPDDVASVDETRSIVREWISAHGGTSIERESNLGLSGSITSAVTDLCSEFGRAIVLEDDLLVRSDFLGYMIEGLNRYEAEERIMQISGFMFPVDASPEDSAFFLPLTTTWGWATWERAWMQFDWSDAPELSALEDKGVRDRFDLGGAYPYSTMLRQRVAGLNSSWGILWWWRVFRLCGLVLYPPEALVWVGGFDNSGTHCGTGGEFNRTTAERFAALSDLRSFRLPRDIQVDDLVFEQVKNFLRETSHTPSGSIAASVRRGIDRLRSRLASR